MSQRVTICCVALFLASVSAVQRLRSINDLKKINFGQSVPEHSLLLLHWFANTVYIDNNDVVWLTFDPDNRDYGSHHYGNFEELLDPLPQGQQYYTVGNFNQDSSLELPLYVVDPQMYDIGRNMARIIIRVREQSRGRQRIDQVYITQHYEMSEHQGTRYDPEHTYQITVNLLRQLRVFSVEQNQRSLSELRNNFGSNADDSQLRNIKIAWGNLAPLGLLLFIVIQEKYSSKYKKPQHVPKRNTQPDFAVNIPENRQNYREAYASDTCGGGTLCLVIFIFIILALFIFFLHR